jgi:hypothetical protein
MIWRIMSDFYQAYLNAFSPRVYYNTNTTATPATALVSVLSSRASVSGFHATALCILLVLVAILLSITLLEVHRPSRQLRSSAPLSHALLPRNRSPGEVPNDEDDVLDEPERKKMWKYSRFSINSGVIEVRYRKSGVIEVRHREEATLDRAAEPPSPRVA